MVIEIDAAAEHWVDPRATRRLVALEVSDVDVPPARAGQMPTLFYRVLAEPNGGVRVELWERGEFHDVRRVTGDLGNLQIAARRVALAAAELARGLRQKRAQQQRARADRQRLWAELAQVRANRTVEGPFALRSSLFVTQSREWTSFGSTLAFETNIHHKLRLDWAFSASGGQAHSGPWVSVLDLTLGPARRFSLTPRVDLSVAAWLGVGLLHVSRVSSLDDMARQHESWTARVGATLRAEPRLSRRLRANLGVSGGAYLRRVPSSDPAIERIFDGGFLGLELGLITTPP
ncbi:MAG TPA: hypothetical protein VFQ61_37890 [Polyangiaceae bacterium]|nr:hypothetical protein [Polyangiaceae bacterium]